MKCTPNLASAKRIQGKPLNQNNVRTERLLQHSLALAELLVLKINQLVLATEIQHWCINEPGLLNVGARAAATATHAVNNEVPMRL